MANTPPETNAGATISGSTKLLEENGVVREPEADGARENDELSILEAGEGLRRWRLWDRWLLFAVKCIATVLGIAVIVGMGCMLHYFSHLWVCLMQNNESSVESAESLMIVTIAAPIVSITAITIVFFIAGFRRFGDGDVEKAAGHAAEGGARAFGVEN